MTVHRRRIGPILLALLCAAATGSAGAAAGADEDGAGAPLSGRRQIRQALREADDALASGKLDRAAALYDQVVASTSGDDGQRADALYGVALTEALQPAGERDADRVVAALRELTAGFPRHDRARDAAAGLACFDALSGAGAETERLAARVAELEAALADRNAADGDRTTALEAEAATLREEVDRLRKRLTAAQAELKKKEAALEQVKKTLVGGG